MTGMATVTNLILRVEDCEKPPHDELESAGNPNLKIWIKDYDVWPNVGDNVFSSIEDAIRIASEIKKGNKCIHMALEGDCSVLQINPDMLKAIGDSGCTLEICL